MNLNLTELKETIDRPVITAGNLNTSVSVTDRTSRQKNNKGIEN